VDLGLAMHVGLKLGLWWTHHYAKGFLSMFARKKTSFIGISLGYGSPLAPRSGNDAEVMLEMRQKVRGCVRRT